MGGKKRKGGGARTSTATTARAVGSTGSRQEKENKRRRRTPKRGKKACGSRKSKISSLEAKKDSKGALAQAKDHAVLNTTLTTKKTKSVMLENCRDQERTKENGTVVMLKADAKIGDKYTVRHTKHDVKVKRLLLDDALAQGSFEGWSTARLKAYKQRHENPNAYYYRFNDPGEEQGKGKWTEVEMNAFHSTLKKLDGKVDGQWGLFAKNIPGRVGYQCSNMYRKLIERGEIQDPNYVLDSNGKARFLHKKSEPSQKGKGDRKKRSRARPARRRVYTARAVGSLRQVAAFVGELYKAVQANGHRYVVGQAVWLRRISRLTDKELQRAEAMNVKDQSSISADDGIISSERTWTVDKTEKGSRDKLVGSSDRSVSKTGPTQPTQDGNIKNGADETTRIRQKQSHTEDEDNSTEERKENGLDPSDLNFEDTISDRRSEERFCLLIERIYKEKRHSMPTETLSGESTKEKKGSQDGMREVTMIEGRRLYTLAQMKASCPELLEGSSPNGTLMKGSFAERLSREYFDPALELFEAVPALSGRSGGIPIAAEHIIDQCAIRFVRTRPKKGKKRSKKRNISSLSSSFSLESSASNGKRDDVTPCHFVRYAFQPGCSQLISRVELQPSGPRKKTGTSIKATKASGDHPVDEAGMTDVKDGNDTKMKKKKCKSRKIKMPDLASNLRLVSKGALQSRFQAINRKRKRARIFADRKAAAMARAEQLAQQDLLQREENEEEQRRLRKKKNNTDVLRTTTYGNEGNNTEIETTCSEEQVSSKALVSDYEEARLRQIAENRAKMKALGLL